MAILVNMPDTGRCHDVDPHQYLAHCLVNFPSVLISGQSGWLRGESNRRPTPPPEGQLK